MRTRSMKEAEEQERWIKATLANDEDSTDEELLTYFTENGVEEKEAKAWISKREKYLTELHP